MNLLDYVFYRQDVCHICKEEITDNYICENCLSNFEFVDGYFDLEDGKVYYPLFYNNFLKELVRQYKFEKKTYLVKAFAIILKEFVATKRELDGLDYLTYVPMNDRAEFKRGYNQAQMLAEELSSYLGIEVLQIVEKTRSTKEQNKSSLKDRRTNLLSSYRVLEGLDLKGKKILLIDDLVTTGNTIEAMSRVILDGYDVDLRYLVLTSSKIKDLMKGKLL